MWVTSIENKNDKPCTTCYTSRRFSDISLVDEHMETHSNDEDDSDQTSHRLNLEAESLRNKAMLHVLQQGISVDKDGEKVYLQDVYNRDTDLGEEE